MDTISDAINDRRVLLIDYYDSRGWRRVEPHCCGLHASTHAPVVRVFQVCGPSRSDEGELFWKLMRLDRIEDLQVLDETFTEARPDYSPGDKHIDPIYADFE